MLNSNSPAPSQRFVVERSANSAAIRNPQITISPWMSAAALA